MERCPACEKPLREITDYPGVKLVSVVLTEIKDGESASARRPAELAAALRNPSLLSYLNGLKEAEGHLVMRDGLLPRWIEDARFRGTYRLPGEKGLLVSLNPAAEGDRADVVLWRVESPGSLVGVGLAGSISYEGFVFSTRPVHKLRP